MISEVRSISSSNEGRYVSSSISLSTFLYLTNASTPIKVPNATRAMPKIDEYPKEEAVDSSAIDFPKNNDNFFMKNANFSTTKPNAIKPILVLIHARNVLSFAM